MCVNNNHDWIQGVQYLLCENGFGNVWANPNSVNKDNFHKYFKQRLNDQHIQNWNSKIANSNRFQTLRLLYEDYELKTYVQKIRNPSIREIYTRLRIDMNILSTSRIHGNQHDPTCFLCQSEIEAVGHFILRCPKYQASRSEMYEKISRHDSSFCNLNEDDKLRYILDARCPEESLGTCCNYVFNMYKERERDNLLKPT